jgi:azurin
MKLKIVVISTLVAVMTSPAYAKVCRVDIKATDAMQFDKKEISVSKSCSSVELTLTYTGTLPKAAMRHNWVLSTEADAAGVIADSLGHSANDYLPPNDKRVVAATKMIGGGEKSTVTFSLSLLKPTEKYKFFCTYPGHHSLMTGKLFLVP